MATGGALCERVLMQRKREQCLHMIMRLMTKAKMRTISLPGNAADHTEHTARAARSAEERSYFCKKAHYVLILTL